MFSAYVSTPWSLRLSSVKRFMKFPSKIVSLPLIQSGVRSLSTFFLAVTKFPDEIHQFLLENQYIQGLRVASRHP